MNTNIITTNITNTNTTNTTNDVEKIKLYKKFKPIINKNWEKIFDKIDIDIWELLKKIIIY